MPADAHPAGPHASAISPPGGRLPEGTSLGDGRFSVGRYLRRGLFAEAYEASDARAGGVVTLHLLHPQLAGSRPALAAIGPRVQAVSRLRHDNIARPLELFAAGDGAVLVTEPLEGNTVRELLERKRAGGGGGFAPKGAYNIAAHILGALAAAHEATVHGAITLDCVTINRAGLLKLSDFGLAAALPYAARAGLVTDTSTIAPELSGGGNTTPAADIYSVGALLYHALVGAAPARGCRRPSELIPGLPPAIDEFIARSMAPDPRQRFASARDAAQTLAQAFAAPARQSSAPAPGAAAAPSLAAQVGAPAAQSPSGPVAGRSSSADVLAGALADTEERWLVSKGKLDYGPFTLAAIVEQIRSDAILPGHIIVDKDTGTRCAIEEHPLLHEVVDTATVARDERRRAHAEDQHAAQEKRRSATLYVLIAVGALALAAGAYLLVTKLGSDHGAKATAGLSSLEKDGQLKAKISFPAQPRHHHAGSRHAHKNGALGYNDSLDLDLSKGGGDERLSNAQLNAVIQRHGGRLGRCLLSTHSRSAAIDFIVKGDGKVSGVRVNGKTGGALAGCISRAMRAMTFPKFNGTRTKGTFNIQL